MKCYYLSQLSGEDNFVLALDITEAGALQELCCPPKSVLSFLESDPDAVSVTRRWNREARAYAYISHDLSEQITELEELYEGPAMLIADTDEMFNDEAGINGCFIESSRGWSTAEISWAYDGQVATADVDHIRRPEDLKTMPFRVSILNDYGFIGWSYLGGRRNYGKPDNQTGFRLCRRAGGPARS